MEMKGYCVKCKEKGVVIQEPVIFKSQRGTYMVKGTHTCGTGVCCTLNKEKAKKAIEEGIKFEG